MFKKSKVFKKKKTRCHTKFLNRNLEKCSDSTWRVQVDNHVIYSDRLFFYSKSIMRCDCIRLVIE